MATCAICLEPIGESEYKLECDHTFHRQCVTEWFDTQLRQGNPLTCPLCRQHHNNPQSLPSQGISSMQMKRLVVDGILSLPTILEVFFFPQQAVRVRRVIGNMRPIIQQFYQDPNFSLTRLGVLIGAGLAMDRVLYR